MRDGWHNLTMLEACDLITCGVAARPNYVDEGIPFLSAKNVKEGKILYTDFNSISLETHLELTKKNKPLPGDILYTRVGSYGEAAVIEKEIEFSVFVSLTLIKPKRKLLDSHFLRYYLNSPEIKTLAKKSIKSSGVGNLNVGTVRKFPVKIPPIEEQKEIVEIIDKAFESIDKAKANIEKNIENAKELFQSKANQIFSQAGEGWEETNIGEIGKVSMCKRILKHQTSQTGEIPFYKIGTFGKEPNAYINAETFNLFKEKYSYPKIGDILLSASGTIGRRVIFDGKPAYFQDSNIVWIDNNEEIILNKYLYHFYEFCDWNPSKGATIKRLYNNDLRRIKISYPTCLEKQKEIIEVIEILDNHIQSLLTSYEEELKNLEELKKSILQKAFSGELTNKNKAA
jgi:type I restriction enzyme S subunit